MTTDFSLILYITKILRLQFLTCTATNPIYDYIFELCIILNTLKQSLEGTKHIIKQMRGSFKGS